MQIVQTFLVFIDYPFLLDGLGIDAPLSAKLLSVKNMFYTKNEKLVQKRSKYPRFE